MVSREYPALPMVGVGAVVWRDERVLMIRRGKEPRLGQWSLPGGLQELGETVAEAAAREVREETGVEIGAVRLVDVVDAVQHDADGRVRSHYTLVDVTAPWRAGEPAAGSDAMEARWMTLAEVRALVTWGETVRIVEMAHALHDAAPRLDGATTEGPPAQVAGLPAEEGRPANPQPGPARTVAEPSGAGPRIEFFFDVGSPWTFFCHRQLPALAARTGVPVAWRPFLLGGVFKLTGNPPPVIVPAKRVWQARDLELAAARLGLPFRRNPHFPVNTLALMRGAVAAGRLGCFLPYVDAVFAAIWIDGRDMADAAEAHRAVAAAGLDAAAIFAGAATEAVKAELRANTEEAVARGAFGSPTLFLGDQMFFGQDRLADLEAAVRAAGRPG